MGITIRLYGLISPNPFTISVKQDTTPYPFDTGYVSHNGVYPSGTSTIEITGNTFSFGTQYWVKLTDTVTNRFIIENVYVHDAIAYLECCPTPVITSVVCDYGYDCLFNVSIFFNNPTHTITITNPGADLDLFDLYSNVDSFTVPFISGVTLLELIDGYVVNAPIGATIIRVQSNGLCTNYVDTNISTYVPTCTLAGDITFLNPNYLIQLTTAGIDTGPFNLYSNVSQIPFATNISRSTLLAGYSVLLPSGATTVNITSIGICTNSITLSVPVYVPLTSFFFQGFYETNDPQHPSGGVIVYIDGNGDEVISAPIWIEDGCVEFIAQSIVSHLGAGTCSAPVPVYYDYAVNFYIENPGNPNLCQYESTGYISNVTDNLVPGYYVWGGNETLPPRVVQILNSVPYAGGHDAGGHVIMYLQVGNVQINCNSCVPLPPPPGPA